MPDEKPATSSQPAGQADTPEMRHARVLRFRAQLKAIDGQVQRAGRPERVSGLLADRARIISDLREMGDDAFLRDYLANR